MAKHHTARNKSAMSTDGPRGRKTPEFLQEKKMGKRGHKRSRK